MRHSSPADKSTAIAIKIEAQRQLCAMTQTARLAVIGLLCKA